MRIVISDSSCLIDLRKVSLLDAFLRLPYDVLIPNTLFEDELLKFTAAQKKALVRGGLKVVDLPGDSVLRARQLVRDLPHLFIHDGFTRDRFVGGLPSTEPARLWRGPVRLGGSSWFPSIAQQSSPDG